MLCIGFKTLFRTKNTPELCSGGIFYLEEAKRIINEKERKSVWKKLEQDEYVLNVESANTLHHKESVKTKKMAKIVDEWVERYDIIDYFGEDYGDRMVFIGLSKDGNWYKKVCRV